MKYFPVFFDLDGQPVLVVGGGEVALRKVDLLERCRALITVVAPEILPEFEQRGSMALHRREFIPEDLRGPRLVIVATSDHELNAWIGGLCDAMNVPVNVVDDREVSRFIVPAIVDRDPVLIAVSTGGTSPVLARRVRERLEASIPKRLGELATWLQGLRRASAKRLSDTRERRRWFESLVDGQAARRFIDGDITGAERIAANLLEAGGSGAEARAAGSVALVGAGPGDPELLTLRALRALQDADVILYDRLVSIDILDLARRDAARICVGKSAGGSGVRQEEINEQLIRHAREGKRVVRLKGGDPFVFGRGGEELEALSQAGIDFSVVPGITAALGCAAYAGIPLTHRDFAHSITFVTGHSDRLGREPDWHRLALPGNTIVFYMGLARLHHIVTRLIEHGAPHSLPAALVAQGTLPGQRVVRSVVGGILAAAAAANLRSPTLLIVGEVAGLSAALARFGEPLARDPRLVEEA